MAFNPLPREGVHGTLYLYQQSTDTWGALTWSGGQYHSHGERTSLGEIIDYADSLLWAKDWPRVETHAATAKMSPLVRVEFEYADGRIQRLTGEHAESWAKNVNNIITLAAIRAGSEPMTEHPWVFTHKDD